MLGHRSGGVAIFFAKTQNLGKLSISDVRRWKRDAIDNKIREFYCVICAYNFYVNCRRVQHNLFWAVIAAVEILGARVVLNHDFAASN